MMFRHRWQRDAAYALLIFLPVILMAAVVYYWAQTDPEGFRAWLTRFV